VALAYRPILAEPSKQKLKNAQSPWPPHLTWRPVVPAFQPKRAGGSRAAARAVADAMPFLTRSGKASIVVADILSAKSKRHD